MINVNFTLIIQGLNFLIAYVLINKLLLKPAIKIINQEEVLEQSLQLDLEKAKKNLEVIKNLKREKWERFQKHFSQNSPDVLKRMYERLERPAKPFVFEDLTQVEKLTKDLEDYLVNKVENV